MILQEEDGIARQILSCQSSLFVAGNWASRILDTSSPTARAKARTSWRSNFMSRSDERMKKMMKRNESICLGAAGEVIRQHDRGEVRNTHHG